MTKEVLALPYECWRWIPGYEDIAQVSTMGNVKTVGRWVLLNDGRKHFRKERILKPTRNKEGYLRVGLSRNGKKRRFLVHRLVAETWLDNPENKPQVHHRNEQKDMNFVENLSWATAKENSNWGTRNKRRADKLSMPVEAVDPNTGQVVMEFSSTMEAGRKGFDSGHISACCRGERKTHKGFAWRFKER